MKFEACEPCEDLDEYQYNAIYYVADYSNAYSYSYGGSSYGYGAIHEPINPPAYGTHSYGVRDSQPQIQKPVELNELVIAADKHCPTERTFTKRCQLIGLEKLTQIIKVYDRLDKILLKLVISKNLLLAKLWKNAKKPGKEAIRQNI